MQFTDWSDQVRRVYNILAWTAQSINCHIALKATFYLLIMYHRDLARKIMI